MPIYDFRCQTCHSTVEKLVPMDTKVIDCPNCGDAATRQLSAPGGFDLKGDGWYKPSASCSEKLS